MKLRLLLVVCIATLSAIAFVHARSAEDPCEGSGDPLGPGDVVFELAPFTCEAQGYFPLAQVVVFLQCSDGADCEITGITAGGDTIQNPDSHYNEFSVPLDPEGTEVVVTLAGAECDQCCLVLRYSARCCTGTPPACVCPGGNCPEIEQKAGICNPVSCNECPQNCPPPPIGDPTVDPYSDLDSCEIQTNNSVHLYTGHKRETETDLRIRMPGQDFIVSRTYSSDPAYSSEGLLGSKWSLSPFASLHFPYASECAGAFYSGAGAKHALPGGANCILDDEFAMEGPTDWFWIKSTIDDLQGKSLPVWRLVAPGESERLFIRPNESGEENTSEWHLVDDFSSEPYFPAGQLIRSSDLYGNRHDYKYKLIGFYDEILEIDDRQPRLEQITLSVDDGAVEVATLDFQWIWHHWDPAKAGNLKQITVRRGSDKTQRVIYTYMDTLQTEFSPHLGRTGDLVQVLHEERCDDNETWRQRVTQYRYHNGHSGGSHHQLKMVINSEQIEYFSIETQSNSLMTAAAELLSRFDDSPLPNSSFRVIDLAAKVIEQYETFGSKRVLVQQLFAGCGCAGGSNQATRLVYTRTSWGDGVDTVGLTTTITEQIPDGLGDWEPYRKVRYDTRLLGDYDPVNDERDTRVPYVIHRVVTDLANNDQWVSRKDYDEQHRNLLREFTPASIDDYIQVNGVPTAQHFTDKGLVHHYTYNDSNRRTEIAVSEGYDELVAPIVIARSFYADGQGSTPKHLLEKIERYPDESGTNPEVTEFFYTFFADPDRPHAIAAIERRVQAEAPTENGPSQPTVYSSFELFDQRGNNIWSMAADGVLTRREFDGAGQLLVVERNADNSIPSHPMDTSGSEWAGRHADGESLTTTYVRDLLGRVVQRTSPDGVSSYTRRAMESIGFGTGPKLYMEVSLPHEIVPGALYSGPAVVRWLNAANQLVASYEYLVDSYDPQGPLQDYSLANLVAKRELDRSVAGVVTQETVWWWLPANEQKDITLYEYDALGRLDYTIAPNGTVRRNVYDIHDRLIRREVGLDPEETSTVSEFFYDHVVDGQSVEQGVGNGHLTLMRQHVSDAEYRDTLITYDYRGRRVLTENPAPPHQWVVYDNLDRAVERGLFETVPTDIDDPSRGHYSQIAYSRRGLPYRQGVAINPDPNSTQGFLETHTWYDQVGRAIARWSPNAPMQKTSYDGLGRPVAVHTVTGGRKDHDDIYDPTSRKAIIGLSTTVIEQLEYRYIDGQDGGVDVLGKGKLDLVTTRRRLHNSVATGDPLDGTNSITTFTGTDYDLAGRPIRTINFGTGKPDEFTNDFVAPILSVTASSSAVQEFATTGALFSETVYDEQGRVKMMIDPKEIETRFFYDNLGRRVGIVENHDPNGIPELVWNPVESEWAFNNLPQTDDKNRITSYVFDGIGNLTKQSAHTPGQTQKTLYQYGVDDQSDPPSDIASNDLLRQITYPEGQAGLSIVRFAYNLQGEVTQMLDQNGTEHTYDRDALGRVTRNLATPPGWSGGGMNPIPPHLDFSVRAIHSSYDSMGRLERVASSSSVDDSNIVNAVEFQYTPLGEVQKVFQQHDGDVTGSSPFVEYAYDQAKVDLGNYSRRVELVYPGAGAIGYRYEQNGIDDIISRVTGIDVPLGASEPHGVDYQFIGMSMPAIVNYDRIDVRLDRTVQADGVRPGGEYPGFDGFGRVVRHMWVDGDFETQGANPNRPPVVELTHTYDAASNRLTRFNENPTLAWSHSYAQFAYDDLHRLVMAEYDASDSFSQPSRTDAWELDVLGNWKEANVPVSTVTDPGEDFRLDERVHNGGNELLSRRIDGWHSDNIDDQGQTGGDPKFYSTYDANGNMISQEMPLHVDPCSDFPDNCATKGKVIVNYTYDAWNRLVRVKYENDTRAEYQYNGLNWRIFKRADTSSPPNGTLNHERVMYYSAEWQLLEEHIHDIDVPTSPPGAPTVTYDRHMQYVWGTRYIDDIVLRRQDSSGNGTFDTTWYHLTDTLFSTVAILDDAANLVERVSYTAYGYARHHHPGDLTGDGAVTSDDVDAMADRGVWGVGDITRTGTVNGTDQSIVGTQLAALRAGRISATDNIIGYAGYVFNAEIHGGGLYTVRHRHYSPELGRWTTRDPIGYVDGMSLYEYVSSMPTHRLDPLGLRGIPWPADKTCVSEKTGRKQWRFDGGQQIPTRQPVKLPTPGGWFGVGVEIWGIFSPPEISQWRDAGDQWHAHEHSRGGGLHGVSCRCRYRLYEEVCTTCCVQRRRLVYAPRSRWGFAVRDEGKPTISIDCDYKPTGKREWTYGTLQWSGGRYTCTCISPTEIVTSLELDLEFGTVPKEYIPRARQILDDFHAKDLCCK